MIFTNTFILFYTKIQVHFFFNKNVQDSHNFFVQNIIPGLQFGTNLGLNIIRTRTYIKLLTEGTNNVSWLYNLTDPLSLKERFEVT